MAVWQRHLSRRFPWLTDLGESVSKLWRPLVITSLLVTGGTLGMRYLGLMQPAELAAYDQLVRRRPAEPPDDRILVVGITEADLQTLQEANISDRTLFRALSSLQQYEPQTIAIDIFRDIPHEPGWQDLLGILKQYPNTTIICKISELNNPGTAPPPGISQEQVGFADLAVDPGGILRRNLLLAGTVDYDFPVQHGCNEPGQVLVSFSLRAAMGYLEAQGHPANFTEEGQLLLGSTPILELQANMGGYQKVDTGGYQIMLRYRAGRNAVPEVSLMEVINHQVEPELIRDRIVFIGYTNPLLKDTFYTPYSAGKDDQQQMPGVVIHAQATSQLISAVLNGRPLVWAWPQSVEILWILAWSVMGGLLGWYLRHPAAVALFLLIGGGAIYATGFLVFMQGGWIPLVPPAFTFFSTAVGVVLLDRFNNSAYGQQVYKSVKNFLQLDIDIDEEKLEQQVTEITETDYFRDLQDTVKNLREHPDALKPQASPWATGQAAAAWNHQQDGRDDLSHRLEGALSPEADSGQSLGENHEELDFLESIKAQSQPLNADCAPSEDDGELDFLESIKAQSQAMKAHLAGTNPDSTASPLEPPTASNRFGETEAPSLTDDYALDFIQQLNQQAQQLKHTLEDKSPLPQKVLAFSSPEEDNFSIQNNDQSGFSPFQLETNFCEYLDNSPLSRNHMAELISKLGSLRTKLAPDSVSQVSKHIRPRQQTSLPYLTPVNAPRPHES